ncbi:MAG: phage tail assembly chaperone [Sphingomonas sp.]|nr:phage tail assembly chaperone [Sphingomonas sp.]
MQGCFGVSAAELCGAATALLGWRPDDFWAATPAELALALEPLAGGADAPDKDAIEELRKRFPDE